MFQDQQITCLSCSKVMKGVTVSSLPMNPYMRPRELVSPIPPHLREDLFYSDSDEEITCKGGEEKTIMETNLLENEARNRRVIKKVLETNNQKIQELKEERKLRNDKLKETIAALDGLKLKLEDEVRSNRNFAKMNINLLGRTVV